MESKTKSLQVGPHVVETHVVETQVVETQVVETQVVEPLLIAPVEGTIDQQIQSLHKEMRELTLKAGVDESVYDKILEVDLKITGKEIERKLKFLNAIRATYLHVKHIYGLVPAHAWDNYKMFGFQKLAEQKELDKARRKLCNRWNRRYGKKTPKDSDKTTDSIYIDGESVHTE